MNQYYHYNEKVPCTILNYRATTRSFLVRTITDGVLGCVVLGYHPIIYRILINALNNHETVLLNFQRENNGKLYFKYILEKPQTQEVEPVAPTEPATEQPQENTPETEQEIETMSLAFKSGQDDLNLILINNLLASLGDEINSPEKYDIAVNLLAVNKRLKLSTTLSRDIYNKCNNKFKAQLWNDDILPYCSNHIVAKAWKNADEDTKKAILTRLGIDLNVNSLQAQQGNAQCTTQEMEQRAVTQAVSEIRKKQKTLNRQRQQLHNDAQQAAQRRARLQNQRNTHSRQTVERMRRASNDAQRRQIQQTAQAEQNRLTQQIHDVETQQQQMQSQIQNVNQQLEQTQRHIHTVQNVTNTLTEGGRGKLKINLKWGTIDDVDLHVYDPDGNHIYYRDKKHTCQGVLGQLDIDANAGSGFTTNPQENIYWEQAAPVGHYKVEVNLYCHRSGASQIPFTVTIYPEKGEPRILTDTLTTQNQTIHLLEFNYDDNGIHYNN